MHRGLPAVLAGASTQLCNRAKASTGLDEGRVAALAQMSYISGRLYHEHCLRCVIRSHVAQNGKPSFVAVQVLNKNLARPSTSVNLKA
ncbi:hypothetical protein LY78DRAFT_336219 [Colletotrichum sublineola]|nr:hypothetical protein LY78DRAFT_336219 [Colletotrichum sublineola]